MCCRGGGEGGRSTVLFGTAGQQFGVWGKVAVCEPELIEGDVRSEWGVLLRCSRGFLSYACAVGWVIYVFYDEGGELG